MERPSPLAVGRSVLPWTSLLFFVMVIVWWGTSPAAGDVIVLRDGSRLEGDIRKTPEGWVVVGSDGKQTTVATGEVARMEARPKVGPDTAEQRLNSLRNAVKNTSDPKLAIERYKTFIDQNKGVPALEQAKAELAVWQDRLDRGLIKIGDKWVTPGEKQAVIDRSYEVAEKALKLMKSGRLNEAAPVLESALAENPQNAAALYLRGLMFYRQDKIPDARKAFEATSALVPDHAATFNNLAIVLWRQNAHVAALNQYDRAMLASPNDRFILDNLAEALNALPEEHRGNAATKKVVRHFNEQDLALAAKMKEQGLYRWGATWVPAADLERLQAAEREIRATLDRMSADYDAITARLQVIDDEVTRTKRVLKRMEADTYGRDAEGRLIRYPLPRSYYDYVRDLSALTAERAARVAEQERMRKQARQIQQRLPIPRYTGVQRMVDAEGAPLPGAAAGPVPAPAAAVLPPAPVAPAAPAGGAPVPAPGPVVAVPVPVPAAPPATRPATTPPAAPMPNAPVPPEKPSILDRSIGDGAPPPPRGLLDEPAPQR